jgi:hypothetical protein
MGWPGIVQEKTQSNRQGHQQLQVNACLTSHKVCHPLGKPQSSFLVF